MRRYTVLAAALLLTVASASADEVSDYERFQLWNECRPMRLSVERLPKDAATIDLTTGAIEITVRSRLRAARLYSNDGPDDAGTYLYVNVNVVNPAYGINVEYRKFVKDFATTLAYRTTTWEVGLTGTHGQDSNSVLSSVAHSTDLFIDEYLRVNADACK